jgi:hypothetical protein
MTFEDSFPDEIIVKICRYLHPIDILLSFSGLNARLTRTIDDFIRHVHLSSIISYKNYRELLRVCIPSIHSSIRSLTISNRHVPCLGKLFLENCVELRQWNIRKVSLSSVTITDIYGFVSQLTYRMGVEEFVIECRNVGFEPQQDWYKNRIAQLIFLYHPQLTSIELRGDIVFNNNDLWFFPSSDRNKTDGVSHSMLDVRSLFFL